MNDFLTKYYPEIKQQLHKNRILNLIDLLNKEQKLYEEIYKERVNNHDKK
jgi:hypothetical protein